MPSGARASGRAAVRSRPSNAIEPESILTRPMRQPSSVVLPTPLRPMRLTQAPFGTSRSMSQSVWLWPYDWFSLAIERISLTEVDLDDARVVLDRVHGAFGEHVPFMQNGDFARDR